MINTQLKENSGFTMIELIISIAILSFGILGVYGIFYPMVNFTYDTALRYTASNLAQEGLEIVRNMRDTNFVTGGSGSQGFANGLLACQTGCQLDYKTGTPAESQEDALKAYDQNEVLRIDSDGFYSYAAGTDTPFKRQITIAQISNDVIQIVARMDWEYNGKSSSFESEEYLYNWY